MENEAPAPNSPKKEDDEVPIPDNDTGNPTKISTLKNQPSRDHDHLRFEVLKVCPLWTTKNEKNIYRFIVANSSGSTLIVAYGSDGKEISEILKKGKTYRVELGPRSTILSTSEPEYMPGISFGCPEYLKLELSQLIQPETCNLENPKCSMPFFNFTPLNQLRMIPRESIVDVIGVVDKIIDGNPAVKVPQKVIIKSKDNVFMEVNCWEPMTKEVTKSIINKQLAIKAVEVDEYNGKKTLKVSTARSLIVPLPTSSDAKKWLSDEQVQNFWSRKRVSSGTLQGPSPSRRRSNGTETDENSEPSPSASITPSREVPMTPPRKIKGSQNRTSPSPRTPTGVVASPKGSPGTPKKRGSENHEFRIMTIEEINRRLDSVTPKPFVATVMNVKIAHMKIHRYFACPACYSKVGEIDIRNYECPTKACTREKTSNTQKYAPMLRNVKLYEDDNGEPFLDDLVCYSKIAKFMNRYWKYDDEETLRSIKELTFPKMIFAFNKNANGSLDRRIYEIECPLDMDVGNNEADGN